MVRSGARAGGRHLVVQVGSTRIPMPLADSPQVADPGPVRVGFVVGRSVGTAVTRNRVSRRLRAHLAQRLADLPGGLDVVVRALPSAADASFEQLASDADRCLDRALSKVGQRAGTSARRVP